MSVWSFCIQRNLFVFFYFLFEIFVVDKNGPFDGWAYRIVLSVIYQIVYIITRNQMALSIDAHATSTSTWQLFQKIICCQNEKTRINSENALTHESARAHVRYRGAFKIYYIHIWCVVVWSSHKRIAWIASITAPSNNNNATTIGRLLRTRNQIE